LIDYLTGEIQTLEPELQFAKFGVRKDVPKGFDVLAFPQTNKILHTAVSTIAEGVNPVAYGWNSTAYTASLAQYGIYVQITDILARESAISVIDSAVRQIRKALARQMDYAIQVVVNAGTYGVLYGGGKASRATVAAGDIMDTSLYTKGIRDIGKVSDSGVEPFANGAYAVIMHNSAEYDLMSNTNTGGWLDVARYATPDQIVAGKVQAFRGGMTYRSPFIQEFSSTVDVYPSTIIGKESFGWGFFEPIQPILVNTPDSNNPLNLYTSVGGKFSIGITRFEDASATSYRIVRMETAVS